MPSYNSTLRKRNTHSTRRVKSANSSAHSNMNHKHLLRNQLHSRSKVTPKRSTLRYIPSNYPKTPSRRYTRSIIL